MKAAVLLLLLVLPFQNAVSDVPRNPNDSYVCIPSVSGEHVLTQWPRFSNSGQDISFQWNVMNSQTSESLWKANMRFAVPDFSPEESELFLSSDGEKVAVVRLHAFYRSEEKMNLADVQLVWIFNKGKLLSTFTVRDLGLDMNLIRRTASNIRAFVDDQNFRRPNYGIKHSEGWLYEKLFGGSEDEVFATFGDGQRITWSLKTGKITKREKLERPDGRKNVRYGE